MHTYIEIVSHDGSEVVKRFEATGGQRSIDRTEAGVQINLDHKNYFTRQVVSETPLEEIG